MKRNEPGNDSRALQTAILALVNGGGRGGLSRMAESLGMTVSAFRKRLLKEAAFDEPTIRATILIQRLRAENYPDAPVESCTKHGPYVIETRRVGAELIPTWRTK